MTRRPHFFLQPDSGAALVVDSPHTDRGGAAAVLDSAPETEARELQGKHLLTPIADGPDVRLDCTCGWLSGAFETERLARKILGNECPVGFLLTQSAERRRALRVRLGSGE